MKKFLTFQTGLLLVLVLSVDCLFAQEAAKKLTAEDTAECLIFTGKLDPTMKNAEGDYTVKLIRENTLIEKQVFGIKKGFKLVLRRNMFYTIKVEKAGFIPRLFSISTVIPSSVKLDGDPFLFNFETSLISEDLYHHFDDDDMDFPLALINYDKSCDCFEYNKKYTEKIMSAIISRLLNGA